MQFPSKTETIFTPEFEELLAEFLAEPTGAQKDRLQDKLVGHCLPYVQSIARGLARRQGDPVDDLIQVGCVGLMKALQKFNPLTGSRFRTYATYLITGEIRHYLRDKATMIKAPRQMYELYYRMNQMIQTLSERLGRLPNDLEIAEALQCDLSTIQAVQDVDRRRHLVSLDQFVYQPDAQSGEAQYIERLVDEQDIAFQVQQDNRLLIERAIQRLKPELREVVVLTYFEEVSQVDIAARTGVSQMQVSRRLKKALTLLKQYLADEAQPVTRP